MQKIKSMRSLSGLSSCFIWSVSASLVAVLLLGGQSTAIAASAKKATAVLKTIPVRAWASKAGYARSQFGDGWGSIGNCDTRNYILIRDLTHLTYRSSPDCTVATGVLRDPYTGKTINFVRGVKTSTAVQIDHVVALSDSWQKGAQTLSYATRVAMANDPLELLAVDGPSNESKSDSDAANWLPPNHSYWCPYVARQIAVKAKYHLWMSTAEKARISQVLHSCPAQLVPTR